MTAKKSAARPAKQAATKKSSARKKAAASTSRKETGTENNQVQSFDPNNTADILAYLKRVKSVLGIKSYAMVLGSLNADRGWQAIEGDKKHQTLFKKAVLNYLESRIKHRERTGENGGKRAGAGRKEGSATKRTREIADNLTKDETMITPLDYMLGVLQQGPEKLKAQFEAGEIDQTEYAVYLAQHVARRDSMAEKAAPYIHPRLASIQAKIQTDDQAKWSKMLAEMEGAIDG